MTIQPGDTVQFSHARTPRRPYIYTVTGTVVSVNEVNATVQEGYTLYLVPVEALTKVDAETVLLMAQAGAIE